MRAIRRLFELPLSHAALLCRFMLLLLLAELCLRLWPFQTILEKLRARADRHTSSGPPSWPADPATAARLAEAADRHGFFPPSCLRRAVVMAWWLGGRGITADLKIGVAKDGPRLHAHAWILAGQSRLRLFDEPDFADLEATA